MKGYLLRTLWILSTLIISGPGLAAMYKWTDSSGQVHYTDSPPIDQKTQTLDPRTATPSGAEQEKTKLDKQVEEFNKRQEEQQKQQAVAEKKALVKKQRAEQCAVLRSNLQLYLTKPRVAKTENGEQVALPYEERLKEIEKIQDQMKKVCDDL